MRPSESFTTPSAVTSASPMISLVVGDARIVDQDRVVGDGAAHFAVRSGEAGFDECGEHADAGFELGARHLDRRQARAEAAFLERRARGRGGLVGGGLAVHQRGRFGGEHFLRFVDLRALERREALDLVERQHGEQFQEAGDVGVLGVAPVLPVVVGAHLIGVEPHRAGRGLAHLGARRRGDQRRGQREQLRAVQPAAEIDAVDDIAPLVRAAHLQHAAVAAVQLDEIVGLQDHVIEFEERQLLLALEPQLDGIEREHAVDREVAADVAQEIDVVERVEPVGIVGHHRIGLAVAEAQEAPEDFADAPQVRGDDLVGQQPAAFVLAGRIADPGGAAAHQRDRLMAGLLQPVQHHDRQQRADMERRRGAVETDVGRDGRLPGERVQRLGLGDLMDEAPAGENVEEIGFVGAHRLSGAVNAAARRGGAAGVTGPARDSTPDDLWATP